MYVFIIFVVNTFISLLIHADLTIESLKLNLLWILLTTSLILQLKKSFLVLTVHF